MAPLVQYYCCNYGRRPYSFVYGALPALACSSFRAVVYRLKPTQQQPIDGLVIQFCRWHGFIWRWGFLGLRCYNAFWQQLARTGSNLNRAFCGGAGICSCGTFLPVWALVKPPHTWANHRIFGTLGTRWMAAQLATYGVPMAVCGLWVYWHPP